MQIGDFVTDRRTYVRRKYVRLDRSVVISYKEAGSSDEYDLTSSKDISKGGTFFYSHVNHPVGTELELLVNFPFRIGKERVKIIAKIVNVRKKEQLYGLGVEFIKMDETVLFELHSFIEKLKEKNGLV